MRNPWQPLVVWSLLTSALCLVVRAQDPAATVDSKKAEKLNYFRQQLSELQLSTTSIPPRTLEFVREPLMTFENPISQVLDGFIFVWVDQGRPAVAMKGYYFLPTRSWGRTFTTLSSEKVELTSDNRKLWTPQQGISWTPLPNASKPADNVRLRLPQMREIARRFSMVDRWGLKNPTDYQLRLLPAPLYRYESSQHGVVDGAMFGYVMNSPEALVLIEARKSDEGLAWHYAVTRFTRFAVTVSLDGKPIADYPHLDAWPPTGVYFHDPVPLPIYPFDRS
jgi:hypothetical protein